MGDGHVDERRPGDDVDHERLEPDPLREGADDQRGCDRGELQLKGEVEELGNGVRVSRVGRRTHVVQAEVREVSDETVERGPQSQRVSPQRPHQAHDGEDRQTLRDRRDEVLPADESAIEEAEGGSHDHDEGRGRDDPRDVSGVERHVTAPAKRSWPPKAAPDITFLSWAEVRQSLKVGRIFRAAKMSYLWTGSHGKPVSRGTR